MDWNTDNDGTLWNNRHTAYLEVQASDGEYRATASLYRRGSSWHDQGEYLPVAEQTFATEAEAVAWLEEVNEKIDSFL